MNLKGESDGRVEKVHNEELHNLKPSAKKLGFQVREDEMDGACGRHKKEEKYIEGFDKWNLKEGNYLSYWVDGRKILK